MHKEQKLDGCEWQPVCHVSDLLMEAGVAVRAHGCQVAIFHTEDGFHAIDNVDPTCGAAVLSRGIVGELKGKLVVASPMYKHHFCLRTGRCMEDERIHVRPWPVRQREDGMLVVGLPAADVNKEKGHVLASAA